MYKPIEFLLDEYFQLLEEYRKNPTKSNKEALNRKEAEIMINYPNVKVIHPYRGTRYKVVVSDRVLAIPMLI